MLFQTKENAAGLDLPHQPERSTSCEADMLQYMYTVHTVYPEILATFLIWRFGGEDQNRQISITKFI